LGDDAPRTGAKDTPTNEVMIAVEFEVTPGDGTRFIEAMPGHARRSRGEVAGGAPAD
jgi:hypothetical protein